MITWSLNKRLEHSLGCPTACHVGQKPRSRIYITGILLPIPLHDSAECLPADSMCLIWKSKMDNREHSHILRASILCLRKKNPEIVTQNIIV